MLRTATILLLLATSSIAAQSRPPIRAIGSVERVSSDSLASVATALPMPGGRVLINDITARRVLLFDSTLSSAKVVADTTSATGNAYGRAGGTLISYHGDSALFIDIGSLSMLVLGPTGTIARVMAIPRPDEAQFLIGNVFGLPGFDAHGRLAYYAGNEGGTPLLCCVGTAHIPSRPRPQRPDTALVVRVDLATRAVDTAAAFKITKVTTSHNADAQGYIKSLQITSEILPMIDDWAVCSDGSIAVVRGRDFHIDRLGADGRWTSAPKMPFDWVHVDDDRKLALIDSSARAEQSMLDRVYETISSASSRGAGAGRGGRGSADGRPSGLPIPMVAGRPDLSSVSDYVPPFTSAAVHCDAENNLWIRTSTVVKGQPVYAIANPRGELVDRIQLPAFRTIAGFAPGVVFLAVKDASGVVHLERARVKSN